MIQIFGKPKCFDTRKAERYFKERRIPYQLVDVTKKGISPGEYRRIRVAVGGLQALLDEKSAVGYQPELWQAWMQEEAGSSAGKTRGAGRK